MSMIESKFRFFKEYGKIRFSETIEFIKSSLSKRPKRFYTIHMIFASGKFIMRMVYTIMFIAIKN